LARDSCRVDAAWKAELDHRGTSEREDRESIAILVKTIKGKPIRGGGTGKTNDNNKRRHRKIALLAA
jgi:hypothetical protein